MQRIVALGRSSILLGLIVLCPLVLGRAIANDANSIDKQLLKQWTGRDSKSSSPQQNVTASSDGWVPPDIDRVQPPIAGITGCSLHDVVSNVGARIETFFDNLNRVTARETIQHQTVSRSGTLRDPEITTIDYAASVDPMPGGYLNLQEYRGRYLGNSDVSLDNIKSAGVFNFAVIFHPNYRQGYQMTCEGLGMWQGQPAWQVRFEELPDNPHHLSTLIVKDKSYYLKLRGRAWILADSYQLARLETDLIQPIPEIRLRFQHEVIEYAQVKLSDTDVVMLPSSVELYMDVFNRRFYRRHTYTNFQLFSVKVHEKVGTARE